MLELFCGVANSISAKPGRQAGYFAGRIRAGLPAVDDVFGPAEDAVEGDVAAVGADCSVVAPECLVGAHLEDDGVRVPAAVEERDEVQVEVFRERGADFPRGEKVLGVVFPDELFADFIQSSVEADAVFGGASAVRPFAAEVEADDVRAGSA